MALRALVDRPGASEEPRGVPVGRKISSNSRLCRKYALHSRRVLKIGGPRPSQCDENIINSMFSAHAHFSHPGPEKDPRESPKVNFGDHFGHLGATSAPF